MEENKMVPFRLVKISTMQFAAFEDKYKKDGQNVVSLNHRFAFTKKDRVIACFIKATFQTDGVEFMVLECGCFFEIKKDAWDKQLFQEDGTVKVSKELSTHFLMLTIGTARGILHTKTEGSNFAGIMLPTINVSKSIEKDILIPNSNG